MVQDAQDEEWTGRGASLSSNVRRISRAACNLGGGWCDGGASWGDEPRGPCRWGPQARNLLQRLGYIHMNSSTHI